MQIIDIYFATALFKVIILLLNLYRMLCNLIIILVCYIYSRSRDRGDYCNHNHHTTERVYISYKIIFNKNI
ncbi:hypothetical protein SKB0087_15610 [Anaerococcus nagyae]